MPDPRKKIITNRAEYEKRAKAYSDSLGLYNYYYNGQSPFNTKTHEGALKGFVKHSDLPEMFNKLARDYADIYGHIENGEKTAQQLTQAVLYPYPDAKNNTPIGWHYTLPPSKKYNSDGATTERHNAIFVPVFKKPTVEPVLGAEKANVPVKSIAPEKHNSVYQRSLPKQIDKVAYDASGTKVYITVNGQTSAINKTNFPAWRQANQGLWDAYIKNK